MNFTDELIDENKTLWKTMLSHPFLEDLSENDLADERFRKWLRQDYEFVKAALPFVSALKPKAPDEHLQPLSEAEMALYDELDLFEERAESLGVSVENVPRNLTTQSYIQHLIATGYREDYPVGLTVYWTAEKSYHESWTLVEPGFSKDHEFYPFIKNWAGEQFGNFVEFLGTSLNEVAGDISESQRNRMFEQFRWTLRYEIAFWDMAYGRSGKEWLKTRTPTNRS